MTSVDTGIVEELLVRWRAGDLNAFNSLYALVYRDVRRIAAARLKGEHKHRTLQATEIANELYVKLQRGTPLDAQGKTHLAHLLSRAVRNFLVDRAREKIARGQDAIEVTSAPESMPAASPVKPDILQQLIAADQMKMLDAALTELHLINPTDAEVFELHCFGGYTLESVAEFLGVKASTVRDRWRRARAFVNRELNRTR
jgi:RNA polymerase sigma factor (TIGR02999 family)